MPSLRRKARALGLDQGAIQTLPTRTLDPFGRKAAKGFITSDSLPEGPRPLKRAPARRAMR